MLGAPITDSDPGDIHAVPVPGHGWADASHVTRCYRGWLAEHVDTLDAATLEQLGTALRAALDL